MFKTLSVAETNYDSDRMEFQLNWKDNGCRGSELRVEIFSDKTLVLTSVSKTMQLSNFTRKDIKEFIEILQEAETFLAEAELVEKLMGR